MEDITYMLKSIISYLQTVVVGFLVIGFFVYLLIPKMESLEGKCFYYPSEAMNRDFKKGQLFYLKVSGLDLLRYHVEYFDLDFDKSFVIKKMKSSSKGTLNYLFSQKGYLEMKCPEGEGKLLNFK